MHHRQSTLHEYYVSHPGFSQGEGCCSSIATAEAMLVHDMVQQLAKRGNPPPMDSGPKSDPCISKIVKRSYRRACRRTVRYGTAWYQGRLRTISDFPISLVQSVQRECTAPRTMPTVSPQPCMTNRMTMLTWNSGGLAPGRLIELRQWLACNHFDIIVLLETRWSYSKCWQDDRYAYIHSGSPEDRSNGILILLSRRLIHPDHVGFSELLVGRLVHVRLHFQRKAVDPLLTYQHMDSRTATVEQSRAHLWSRLDETLYDMPGRNQVIITGDFNCGLQGQAPWVGSSSFSWGGQKQVGSQHKDAASFYQILQRHGLTALNTWTDTGPTYFHGSHGSRIDFTLMRLAQCDGLSKEVSILQEASFLPANETHHFPLGCSFRKQFQPYHTHKFQPKCTYSQRTACRLAAQQETPAWLHLSSHVAHACATAGRHLLNMEHPMQNLHNRFTSGVEHLLQTASDDKPLKRTVDELCCFDSKWKHRHALFQLPRNHRPQCKHVFAAWFHVSRVRTLQARQFRFQQLCEEAAEASRKHDHGSMFQVINRHSPKKPLCRVRLKTEAGQIADQYMAHELIVKYVRTTWTGPPALECTPPARPSIPFSVEELTQAFMTMHPNKSVASPFYPAIILKSAPRELALLIYDLLQEWWLRPEPHVPSEWRDSWLFFIPKPGRVCGHPSQLRPLALMEPVGKVLIGLIETKLKTFHLHRLCRFPHLGFLPFRAATDALARVSSHCRRVRTIISNQRRTFTQQMSLTPPKVFCGGLQLFLDLHRAFDI